MVITELEARVQPEKVSALQSQFTQAVRHLDAGIQETKLLQGVKDPQVWQIVTLWESRDALDAMRQSGETPRGVLIFRAADAEPELTVWDVMEHSIK